jgi:N-hydroxyarylamine O-acetyltransferase
MGGTRAVLDAAHAAPGWLGPAPDASILLPAPVAGVGFCARRRLDSASATSHRRHVIDIDRYFTRIGYRGPRTASLATLNAIAAAHVQAIPFENLDVLLGRPIDLEIGAVQRKLVDAGRGGYCFEQNSLLLAVLTELGFAARALSGRVRFQRPRDYTPPRTHLFVRVELDGPWLIDVGVGSMSLSSAIRLDTVDPQTTPHETRRIIREGELTYHQARLGDDWHDVYETTLEDMPPIDREVGNWYTSAHPRSNFKLHLMVARALPDGRRASLLDRELAVRERDGSAQRRMLGSPEELLAVLAEQFGLVFPPGTRFPCPGLDWPDPG